MKWIVLTGGAGFIGSAVLKELNEQDVYNILVVDELDESDKWKNLVGKRFLDLIHKDHLFQWLEGKEVEAFIHLGACSSTVERDSNFLLENNYRYTIRLAEYAIKRGCRFIYASSAATYGDGSKGFSDDHALLEQYEPLNMYGYSKHLVDLWMKERGYLDRVVGLKYFNVFGPNEYHKGRMASVILTMVPDLKKTGKIRLFKSSEPEKFGDGDQVRDFIYVKDAAKMTTQFLQNSVCGIFNVGMGRPQTWNTLASGVIEGVDQGGEIEYIAMPKDLLGKYQNYTCAEMKKTVDEKLYLPKTLLKESVADYVERYVLPQRYL
ncbi:MAG: ADP-L-glycero-D-manno-heptose-6-epimerase [Chlamydiales bacterium]|nr:ADP-L-glycero-D-manno-heptose-6-epimerase [Chlamydiales bacterium]MCH9619216.1 ADP-L-glycero-D-manno-heptose-6-epimerase [Chlamydiales bacterium]MCH9622478.1 ADP-L-glycero-D-manno-heptose-6-epimerase [Chlamydiales bacterium]